ncbi:hypothetical protein B0H63DRAFT_522460 [Podospora didyma]|uniref:Uncharacterized protein n=1 Tax=Podospora didyma TaxID=330526 RepID=A0AAE0TZI9_9PEZI|nr:hypothetical protein B0H63DRAFT_522460 [Podospora didyma]
MPSESTSSDPPGSTRNWAEFFSWFETNYNDDKPSDAINEINGQSPDINKGFGGCGVSKNQASSIHKSTHATVLTDRGNPHRYVWLVPRRAPRPRMMVDKFWTDIRNSRDEGRNDDLAKGAGGDYRYFSWSNDMSATQAGDAQSNPPGGWDHKSDDINKGCGGDYLYLVWRTKQYCGPKDH